MKGYRFIYTDLEVGTFRESHIIGELDTCFRKILEFFDSRDNVEFVKLESVFGGGAGGSAGAVLVKGEIKNEIR